MNEENNNDLQQIPIVESSGFDKTVYEGYRVPIEKLEVDYVKDVFPDGKNYDPESKKKKWVLRISTEPLKVMKKDDQGVVTETDQDLEFDNEDGTKDKLRITEEMNFQTQKDEAGKVMLEGHTLDDGTTEMRTIPEISKHVKAALYKFLRKMGCQEDYRKLKGKIVTLTIKPSSKEGDDRVFIQIVTA